MKYSHTTALLCLLGVQGIKLKTRSSRSATDTVATTATGGTAGDGTNPDNYIEVGPPTDYQPWIDPECEAKSTTTTAATGTATSTKIPGIKDKCDCSDWGDCWVRPPPWVDPACEQTDAPGGIDLGKCTCDEYKNCWQTNPPPWQDEACFTATAPNINDDTMRADGTAVDLDICDCDTMKNCWIKPTPWVDPNCYDTGAPALPAFDDATTGITNMGHQAGISDKCECDTIGSCWITDICWQLTDNAKRDDCYMNLYPPPTDTYDDPCATIATPELMNECYDQQNGTVNSTQSDQPIPNEQDEFVSMAIQECDKNGDDKLSWKEIKACINDGVKEGRKEMKDQMEQAKNNMEEWKRQLKQSKTDQDAQLKQIEDIFNNNDLDKDGFADKAELASAFHDIKKVMEAADDQHKYDETAQQHPEMDIQQPSTATLPK